jgi:hypothetical protein
MTEVKYFAAPFVAYIVSSTLKTAYRILIRGEERSLRHLAWAERSWKITFMSELQKYQWATGILALFVIVLGVWLYMETRNDKVTVLLGDINTRLGGCQADIKAWNDKNKDSVSADARKELSGILDNCQDDVKMAQQTY